MEKLKFRKKKKRIITSVIENNFTKWFLKILKTVLPYAPSTPLLCIQLKELKSESERGTCTLMFLAALLKTVKGLEAAHVSMKRRMDKQEAVYTYGGILFSLFKRGNSDMILEDMKLREMTSTA